MPPSGDKLVRYRSLTADSSRWDDFPFRLGDIVISTPPKSGTTWTQMLCALLIFGGPDFPQPLDVMSPWVDMPNRSIDGLRSALAAQRHRRFFKTHTPLDGMRLDERVTYLVVGRDPRDIAISFYNHRRHMDFGRFLEQRAATVGTDDVAGLPGRPEFASEAESFRYFVEDTDPSAPPPNVGNVFHHFETAWRRREQANVVLIHYADLERDLPAELRRMAATLDIELTAPASQELAAHAGIESMRERAGELAPGVSAGHWPDPQRFFHSGGSGRWRELLAAADLAAYDARVAAVAEPALADWAHNGAASSVRLCELPDA